jgi:hypothetical protein
MGSHYSADHLFVWRRIHHHLHSDPRRQRVNSLTHTTTMDNTITIKFTPAQYFFITQLAEDQHRTPEELVALWMDDGRKGFEFTVDYCVKKRAEDRDPEGPDFQHYKEEDRVEMFKDIVFQQRGGIN